MPACYYINYSLFLISSAADLALPSAFAAAAFASPLSSSALAEAPLFPWVTFAAASLALVPASAASEYYYRYVYFQLNANVPAISMPSTSLSLTARSTVFKPSLATSTGFFSKRVVVLNRGACVATRGMMEVARRPMVCVMKDIVMGRC